MNKDLVYIFDKVPANNNYYGYELGEIQTDFNMSLVIDGTKDSSKITVHSFIGEEVEPNTILLHTKTDTWWIVSEDKVERYINDDGYYYIHNLQLEGAIELLNARDLTDCAFNDNTYTVLQFLNRLFSLSNFEYEINFDTNIPLNFLAKKVDFIKTFENYTLLSALREFLDAYNMCPKLTFFVLYDSENDYYTMQYPILNIIQKTGDFNLTQYNIEDFDLVSETKVINKDSFGTCVVSNAENVISSKTKTYPATGSVKLSSTEYLLVDDTTLKDGVIRLPSNVYKGNWLKIIAPITVTLFIQETVTHTFDFVYQRTQISFEKMVEYFSQKILQDTANQGLVDTFLTYVDKNMKRALDLSSSVTLYNGNNINAYTGEIIKGDNVPYLAEFYFSGTAKPVAFVDKETKGCLKDIKQGIAWERGSNLITGFDMLSGGGWVQAKYDDYSSIGSSTYLEFTQDGYTITMQMGNIMLKDVYIGGPSLASQVSKLSFIVNYVPMADLKVKVDNTRDKKDVQLYNQNGKLTDSVALSKLINSYSKEISSDKITRYVKCYDFDDVPKVGSIVKTTNAYYVVNNVSLDFYQNESNDADNFDYFINCEITMSKYVSTKSLMVNPNTNIRDYGIPQNFNVKRKQLYRDYYELTYSVYSDANLETPYLATSKVFNFTHLPNINNFICVIRVGYEEEIESSLYWYYQLETTNYNLDKMLYVVLDFNDNNIIGYGSQNVFSGFDVSRIFTGLTDTINTPISYTDKDGKVKELDILYCTDTQLTNIYQEYQDDNGGTNWEGILYNYSVFIPSDIYDAALENHEIQIVEEDYYKDALEVPVFEYVCQVDDSEDVLIGDNILNQHDGNIIYFYSYVVGNNLTPNNVATTNTIQDLTTPARYRLSNAATIDYADTNKSLSFKIYNYETYNIETGAWTTQTSKFFDKDKDYAIFRHAKNLETGEQFSELMLILKKVPSNSKTTTVLINHYKLK